MLKQYNTLLNFLHRLIDFFILMLIGAYWLHYYQHFAIRNSAFSYTILGALFLVLFLGMAGLYESFREKSFLQLSLKYGLTLIIWYAFMKGFFWFTQTYWNPHVLSRWTVVSFVYLIAVQILLMSILRTLRKRGYNMKQVILIGEDAALIKKVLEQLTEAKTLGYTITQIICDETQKMEGLECTPLSHLDEVIGHAAYDQIWIAYPLEDYQRVKDMMLKLKHVAKDVRFITDISALGVINQTASKIGMLPIIDIRATPLSTPSAQFLKTLEDRVLASVILLLMSPLMLLIALCVKLSSPGPILYRQKRVSINGQAFSMLKFRSMPVDAERETGAIWAKPDEHRATAFGAFLRKTSLDELPQFINVLKGEMSVVGPRPERPELIEKFKEEIPLYMQKHLVKAGITGWAQINGWRGNTDLYKRIEYDLYYIQHWSLWFDFKIILLTIFKGFIHKNAY